MTPARRFPLQRDFGMLWFGQSVSQVGSFVTLVALPLVAVKTLDASAFQVGVLTSLGYAGALIVGLPAGAWIDRRRRRPVLIASDVIRLFLLASVPVAAALGRLTLGQLFVVALLHGTATVFFDVAYATYLPTLVDRQQLVDANSRLETSASVAAVGAPTLGGFLVQLLGPPAALAFDAATFVVSAVSLGGIRTREPAPVPPARQPNLRREVAEGLRLVFRDPILRMSVGCNTTLNLFSAAFDAVAILFLVRTIGVSAGGIGVLLSIGGIGGIIGAVIAARFARRFGVARSIWLSLLLTGPFGLLIPLTHRGGWLALYGIGEFARVIGILVYNISGGTFAQAYTPMRILARVTATRRVIARSSLAVGALLGGTLGAAVGLRGAVWIAVVGQALAPVWLLLSPLRSVRDLIQLEPDGEPAAEPA